jgi:hypothetical protein
MGGYYFELSSEELEVFFQRWEEFYQKAQGEPSP